MKRKHIPIVFIAALILASGLAWISNGLVSFDGWGSFMLAFILGLGIIYAGWYGLHTEKLPGWLGWLMIGAVLLRLGVGVLWYVVLPEWGHATDAEIAGYVMSDAHRRETTAWELAQSGRPLFSAFQDYRFADQYGGLLFLSAAFYRFFGPDTHQPLLIVVLAASFSGLSILFVYVFTRRLWGGSAAKPAAWILAIYPESVLLGSSQMREAFTMTLAGMALYGLILYWQDRKMIGLGWVIGSLLVSAPISSLFTVTLLGILIGLVLVLDRARIMRNWVLWVVLGSLLAAGVLGIWLLGERLYPEGASNPWELISQWLVFAARWEQRTTAISSGWMDKIFKRAPEWLDLWIVLGYGTVQPFLPAALIATGNWIWKVIAIWRALGWTILLVFLLYAPLRAGKNIRSSYKAAGISLVVWFGIVLSAYRGGGDQWDNPRYRVTFIVCQVALAGWVWAEQRRMPDPWLRRILVGLGWVFAWFVPWYLRRYTPLNWPVVDLFKTVGLGFASAVLYWVWDWARSKDVESLEKS